MSRIKDALVSAFTGNLDDMRETFTSELNVKAYDALDVRKQQVAQEMFKEINEEAEQIEERDRTSISLKYRERLHQDKIKKHGPQGIKWSPEAAAKAKKYNSNNHGGTKPGKVEEEAEQIDEVSANKLDKYIDKAQKQTGRTKGTTLALAKIMKKHGDTGVKVGANPNTTTDHRKKD